MGRAGERQVKDIDFGRTGGDYARHRAGFLDAFFERLVALGTISPGSCRTWGAQSAMNADRRATAG